MTQEYPLLNQTETKSQRVTALDVAKIVGCSETSIHRAYGDKDGLTDLLCEKILSVATKIGYKRVDAYAHIPKQFLTGNKTIHGTPEYNVSLLIELKNSGKSVRQISYLSGISTGTLLKIFRNNNISTLNPQTKIINGFSERKRLALRALNRSQIKIKNSSLRKGIAKVIKGYKNGGSVEALSHEIGLNKSAVWNYLKNSFAYTCLNARRVRKFRGKREGHEAILKSKKYKYEKHMTEAAFDYLNQLYPINKIYSEQLVYKTNLSNSGRGGFTCDFLIKETNEIFEVKQRTTTCSNKTLYGQIFVYQSQGYKVSLILPDDVLVTDSMRQILSKNNVDIHLIP
jgi:lambda repressor-like predicted transcriptional regulator